MSQKINGIVGVDVGGTFTRIGFVDEHQKVYNPEKVKTVYVANEFNSFIMQYIKQLNQQFTIDAVSIGFPGIVSLKNKEVISLPNLHILEGYKYLDALHKNINIPVIIEKDTNNLFATDLDEHNLHSEANILGFYVGTGFGNTIRLNGELLRGSTNAAGEIGHIPIPNQHMVCGCGNIGCLETIVSGKEIERIHRTHFPDQPIALIFEKNPKHQALDSFVENLAKAVAMQVTMLDVTTIVIGGGVVAMRGFPKEALNNYIKENTRSDYVRSSLTIYYSKTTDLSGIKGAAITAWKRLEESNENSHRK